MKKPVKIATISSLLVVAVVFAFLFWPKPKGLRVDAESQRMHPGFRDFISAFSSGLLPSSSGIKVRLAFDYADSSQFGKKVKEELFRFKPSIKGETYWTDARTLEFRPEGKLSPGKDYNVRFFLSKLIKVSSELETFSFSFRTIPQHMEVRIHEVKVSSENAGEFYHVAGKVVTADEAEADLIKKTLEGKMNGKKFQPEWTHDASKTLHHFVFRNIPKPSKEQDFEVSFNGRPIETSQSGSLSVKLFPQGVFTVVFIDTEQTSEQSVNIQFTENLEAAQQLEGLITLGSNNRVRLHSEENTIKVFTTGNLSGNYALKIHQAIRSITGKRLEESLTYQVTFEDVKPAVRSVGKGVIMPASNMLILPFEAINLAAVDVQIIRVFESNMGQFLQVNQLSDNREMRRVGRTVARKTIPLSTNAADRNRWNRYSLDLAEVINAEPGAVYQVKFSMKKEYALYGCSGQEDFAALNLMQDMNTEINEDDTPEWGYYDDYYNDYYDYGYYNWSERNDPCTDSYYYNKGFSRNVMASDFGIIAKIGNDGILTCFVTDLVSTQPLPNISIEVFNYQQRLISGGTTDREGKAILNLSGKPFYLVAKKDNQRGYLRLDDGSSLSLSMFDVSGQTIDKGIKGFIYGERGVWRPGDSLHLAIMIEDKEKKLPQNYPVSFVLTNPLGQQVQKMVKTNGVNGVYTFSTATHPDAPTGLYNASFKVGGASFSRSIRIETIMPNRIRIKVNVPEERLMARNMPQIELNAQWLHGADARNLKTEVDITLSPASTSFEKYKDYHFDDPASQFRTESHTIFSGRLDESGKARFTPRISVDGKAPGVLRAAIETRVYEEGGAFSIDRFAIPYYPFSSYVGVKVPDGKGYFKTLETDENHKLEIVNVDATGKPISSGKVKVDVYKMDWRWWWDNTEEYLGQFVSGYYRQPIQSTQVDISSGKAFHVLRVNYPEWGRYLVRITDLSSGHATGQIVFIDWPSWRDQNREGRQEAANMLSFTASKEKYQVGEDIVLTIPTSGEGRLLISLENGTRILKNFWADAKKGTTEFRFKASEAMTPNIFAHVTYIQPHAQTINSLPIRLYGVIPIIVEDPATLLNPVIETAEVFKPEQKTQITVKEKSGKAMTYTLAVVDEGLLDITRFKTPNPWTHFYAREALGVKSWDMYDLVMGAQGSEFSRLLSIGGDDDMQRPMDAERATRFKPVVRYFGPFNIERGKSRSHTFQMPNYVGSVRIMVVAAQDGAYGQAEKAVPVRQPLMIAGTLPRVLGPDETVKLPVTVFAMDPSVKNVTVSLQANEILDITSSNTQKLSFSKTGDQMAYFELKTKPYAGVGRVTISAVSGNDKATFDIELDVRNPNPMSTDVIQTVLEGGKSWNSQVKPIGMAGTNKVTLEVSSIPPLNMEARLAYLTSYPHGCMEQITSGAFPQLYLGKLLSLNEETTQKVENNVKSVINRLISAQLPNGGIPMWSGSNMANDWITSYAGHFMLEARSNGYEVPVSFTDKWRSYQRHLANAWIPQSESFNTSLMQSYRLYTLALSGNPEMGAMNRLREQANLPLASRWRLAAAYQLAGQAEAAVKLAENANFTIERYSEMSYTYGSTERDKAMILETLVLMNKRADAALLVKELSEALSSDSWMSTQSTAFALMAISKYLKDQKPESGIDFNWKLDNQKEQTEKSRNLIFTKELNLTNLNQGHPLIINNKGKAPLFVRIILSGIPTGGHETPASNYMNLSVNFTDLNGSSIDVSRLKQGTSFVAQITVSNPGLRGHLKEIALSQIFPSGWEIQNARMSERAAALKSDAYTYQDVRDDRVYTYFDLNANQAKTFRIMLHAAYEGRYYLPSFSAETMYDSSINARNTGQWVEVFK